ncbi:MAG: PAC2 family protein [Ktedonobacteraceae bacterium]|nr:PAC2 family protein [Ktedonobacteraceae bacterium]
MSYIHYYKQPALRDPVAIVAFGGWNDAADSATTAIKFLIQRWQPTKVAEIEPEDFYVFTETRPTIKFDGTQRSIVWPTNRFLAYSDAELPHDILLFVGVEPQLKWQAFSSTFLEVCKRFDVSEVVFLGALLADIPHSMAVPISGSSSDADIRERLREMDVDNSRYEGPTGILGVLQEACVQTHIPAASLWAAAPHYLAATPNIKVTAALLTYLNTYLSLGLDLHEIQSDAVHFEEQITRLVARDPDASAYVRKLEERIERGEEDEDEEDEEEDEDVIRNDPDSIISSGPLPSADLLIRDVEELLRKQRENGRAQPGENDKNDEENQ